MQYGRPRGYDMNVAGAQAISPARLAFLKKVYGLFTASIVFSAIGGIVALTAGTPVRVGEVDVPPLVMFFTEHWIIGIALLLGSVFGASALRHKPGTNVVVLFAMALIVGVVIGPSLFFAQMAAELGGTISASPIRDAFLLTVAGFTGLTSYALITKKDFSYMRGALTMGFFVVLAALILNLFLASSVFALAIASVGVLLFGAYVLYDTSRLLRSDQRDPVGGAISLYVDFLNIFLFLLTILGRRN